MSEGARKATFEMGRLNFLDFLMKPFREAHSKLLGCPLLERKQLARMPEVERETFEQRARAIRGAEFRVYAISERGAIRYLTGPTSAATA